MLEMFKKKEKKAAPAATKAVTEGAAK
jgi:hypothetical protein